MPNLYKNKVVFGNTTLIDISDTTAVASDVAAGKYFYLASGQKVEGTSTGGGAISVVETQDSHGGTIVTITGEVVNLQSKTATPTTSSQTISPDTGYTGLSQVTVNPIPSQYIVPSGNKEITENGTGIDVAQYSTVSVAVPASSPNLQAKTGIVPTKSSQTIQPDSGYDGLSLVQINAIPAQYITTTDATAEAGDIVSGETAYVNGSKITGSLVIQHYYTGSGAPSSSLGVNGDIYLRTS